MRLISELEIKQIVDSAFRILEESGVKIENEEILERFGESGAKVEKNDMIVRFPKEYLYDFLKSREPKKKEKVKKPVSAQAEIYQGYYLEPETGKYIPWTEELFLRYIKIAQRLPNIDSAYLLGCPLKEVPLHLQPLYEKYYCWKYGIEGGASIWELSLCDAIYEMYEIWAEEKEIPVSQLFQGTVYMAGMLYFGKYEALQFMYFYKRGLRVGVGGVGALGGQLPVTEAGGMALYLAQNLFTNLLDAVFFGKKTLYLNSSINVLDLSSGAFMYGRPEKTRANMVMSQIAEYLHAEFTGHCGLTDAKVPGYEAGVQKGVSAMGTLLTSGRCSVAAGLLSVDEVFSPVQLILDNELLGMLKRMSQNYNVNEEELAMDEILEQGPGGVYFDSEHTAEHCRDSLWQPAIWSTRMFESWRKHGSKSEMDLAREKYEEIIHDTTEIRCTCSERCEEKLRKVIDKNR